MVAMPVLLLVHVPPAGVAVRVAVEETQIVPGHAAITGSAFTVTLVVV